MKDTKKSLVMLKSTQTLKSTPRKVEQITTHSILQSIKFVMSINHSIVQKIVLNKFNFFLRNFADFIFLLTEIWPFEGIDQFGSIFFFFRKLYHFLL